MTLNKYNLNHLVYTHLFSEDLYDAAPGIVIVLAKKWDEYAPEEKNLLSKILGSVKLSITSVHVISQTTFSPAAIAAFSPSKVIVFGSFSEGLKAYEATTAQGFTVLKADDLPQLDDAKKKSLWLALKTMFSI